MKNKTQREKQLAEIGRVAQKSLTGENLEDFLVFVNDFYNESTADDLQTDSPQKLYAIALSFWNFSEIRTPGAHKTNIFNPTIKENGWESKHTVIQIINDDMPFLVDSITNGLSTTHHHRLHMMHHPIVCFKRDEKGKRLEILREHGSEGTNLESIMYIEIDAQSAPDVLESILQTIDVILDDVRISVKHWRAMMAKIDETVASLTVCPPPISDEEVDETIRFLRWMSADHFTFLGFREYRYEGDPTSTDFKSVDESGLGILQDPKRYILRGEKGLTAISNEIRHFLALPEPLIITKANVKSNVHRPVHLDYIGVKIFNENGVVIGERRFVGLFTSLSYSQSAQKVPLLRQKFKNIQARAPFPTRGYGGKLLVHILENFPRDELFQISEDELFETAIGVLYLIERPSTRAFIRRDKFERFVSALVYVPRENYHSGLREAIEVILCKAFNGEISVYNAKLTQESLARWHFIIRTKPGAVGNPDEDAINKAIAEATRGWKDRLHVNLVDRFGEEQGNKLNHNYQGKFSLAYQEAFDPAQAAFDIDKLEDLHGDNDIRADFYRHLADGPEHYRLKIHHGTKVVPLSECLPMLENLGFKVIGEHAYKHIDGSGGCIHDFTLERLGGISLPMETATPLIEELLLRVWHEQVEDDGFNTLTLTTGMNWRQIVILRALAKYLRQIGLPYSPEYVENCLIENSDIASYLVILFEARFDLSFKGDRLETTDSVTNIILSSLEAVTSLDQDRILRTYLNVIQAMLRTNFYQDGVLERKDERALAFKVRSHDVAEVPEPKPYAEIFVFSPQVEGVHLRGGPVARGGLRWSDRREDFRTEVLGLVKAQQVKNAVIVPAGSKGGFYPKNLPAPSDREAYMAEGIASYRSFISSLLSITDNLKGKKVIPPKQVIRHDGDDPYLVVAADKGTATFSDIANEISDAHNFWLSDAFASGGSNGYDHKKMGITAKGAWVGVQRHFRELGINIQEDPITVIGVGDMAGDVFGNGMLLSKTIKMKAAFNHMHIFLDPNPEDTQATWKERKRLFDKPRSSWTDYNKKLISKGGGIFERSAKSIPISAEIREWLKIESKQLPPLTLINLILKAEADLLWFGGIGTYIKATSESNADAGDKANDALRVNANALNVGAVGEGANLGMTQKGRIEFASLGGRVNTDFIDNSAGVDCSDKEVNIKILLADAIARKKITRKERDKILVKMTREVSDIVLSDNYLQTQAISMAEMQAIESRDHHLGLIRTLERDGDLNRAIEFLPSDEKFAELTVNNLGLTRPEISTLISYAKISLFEVLMRSKILENPILQSELEWGFPTLLRKDFAKEILNHRLKREIIATVLSNAVINWAGLTFVYEIKEETGLGVEDIVAAFIIVREIFDLQEVWDGINSLDYKVSAKLQMKMHENISTFLKQQVMWFLRNLPQPFDIQDIIQRFNEPIATLFKTPGTILSGSAAETLKAKREAYKAEGVPRALYRKMTAIEVLSQSPDIIWVAEQVHLPLEEVAIAYFSLGEKMGLEWLREKALLMTTTDRWDMLALRSEVEEISDLQRENTRQVLEKGTGKKASPIIKKWKAENQTRLIRTARLTEDIRTSGSVTVSKLSFATRRLRAILR